MIDLKNSLEILGIKDVNPGVSTGLDSFGCGEEISSFSPVDGSLIGSVTTTTAEEYDRWTAQENGRWTAQEYGRRTAQEYHRWTALEYD